MTLIYNSLVFSSLSYANIIWGRLNQNNYRLLTVAQKKIIRTMKNRNRFHHTNPDFQSLQLLKITEINEYFAGIFTYKSLNNLTVPDNYFFFSNITHNYSLRNN